MLSSEFEVCSRVDSRHSAGQGVLYAVPGIPQSDKGISQDLTQDPRATASARAGATPRTATSTSLGLTWKRPTSRCATTPPSTATTSASGPRATAWSPSRPSLTNWRGPVTTCFAKAATSTSIGPSPEPDRGGGGDLAKGVGPRAGRTECGTATAPQAPRRIDRDRDAPAIEPAKGWTAPAWRRATVSVNPRPGGAGRVRRTLGGPRPRPAAPLRTTWTLVGHRRFSGAPASQGPGVHALPAWPHRLDPEG